MCVYVELPVIGIFRVCSQDFLGFASLSGVFPLCVKLGVLSDRSLF